MRIALGQINPLVGDVEGNARRINACIDAAAAQDADIVLVPELAVVGYPPKDLLLKPAFIDANERAVQQIAERCRGITAVVGYVGRSPSETGKGIVNAAAVCAHGRILASHAKALLPTYDVFDEWRYFDPNPGAAVSAVPIGGGEVLAGFSICEDLWSDDLSFARRLYSRDPVADAAAAGAKLLINIGASPFSVGKPQKRVELFGAKARQVGLPLAYVNQVGGNDDLVFDGASGVLNAHGEPIAQAKSFAEDLLIVDFDGGPQRREPLADDLTSIYEALVLGTRDYVGKCGFSGVVIGASGGIDSAVTAALAVDAVGRERVHLAAMPSRYSSPHSLEDARALATALGVSVEEVPIEPVHAAMQGVLAASFAGRPADVTEENIQARIRGAILMALSNKFGWLLLTTGNKSELAVGYCTLYGDMCGGLAVISDVPKTTVYELAELMNRRAGRDLIPRRTITRAPTAELRPNQTDQDTLPPYDLLDAILERYVERGQSAAQIVAAGFEEAVVENVIGRVDHNEYKRKQAAIGLKVTSRAFGSGWRMPIAAKYS